MKTHVVRIEIRNAQFQPREVSYREVSEEYLVRNLGRNPNEWSKDAIQGAIRGKNVLDNMRLATTHEIERDVYNKHPKAATKKGSKHFYKELPGGSVPEEIKQYEAILEQRKLAAEQQAAEQARLIAEQQAKENEAKQAAKTTTSTQAKRTTTKK